MRGEKKTLKTPIENDRVPRRHCDVVGVMQKSPIADPVFRDSAQLPNYRAAIFRPQRQQLERRAGDTFMRRNFTAKEGRGRRT